MREREEQRKLLGISYPIDTAPFRRAVYFALEMPWPKLKQYASRLELPIYKQKKGDIVNAVVAAEMAEGKEEWTAGLKKKAPVVEAALETPVEQMPPVPTGTYALSNSNNGAHFHPSLNVQYDVANSDGTRITPGIPQGEENKISDARAAQMRQLLASRGLLTA